MQTDYNSVICNHIVIKSIFQATAPFAIVNQKVLIEN